MAIWSHSCLYVKSLLVLMMAVCVFKKNIPSSTNIFQQSIFFIPCWYLLMQIHLFQEMICSNKVFCSTQYPVTELSNLTNTLVYTTYAADANNPKLAFSLVGAVARKRS